MQTPGLKVADGDSLLRSNLGDKIPLGGIRAMTITIHLPQSVEDSLRQALPDLDDQAKEIFLVSLYRNGKLTHHEFSTAMGVTRYEVDGILKRHHVTEDLMTPEEFAKEQAVLLNPPKPR
jgi:hypothetical protein